MKSTHLEQTIHELEKELEELDDMSEDVDQKRAALKMQISNLWYDIENY